MMGDGGFNTADDRGAGIMQDSDSLHRLVYGLISIRFDATL
jgi:hypothetical protein